MRTQISPQIKCQVIVKFPGLTHTAIELRPAFISPEISVHDVLNEGLIRWAPIDVQQPGVGQLDQRMSQ